MASSNPLQPQNRTHLDHTGILKNHDLNKDKLCAVPSSKRGTENLDPNASTEAGKGVNKLRGVSRLPVLARSLQPGLTDLTQNPKWEQRPLTVKAQKKRTCTKPVPFKLSQSRIHSQRNTVATGKAHLTPSAQLTPEAKLRNLNPSARTETTSHKATTPCVLRTQANKSQQLGAQSVVPQPGDVKSVASTKAMASGSTDGYPPAVCSQIDLSSRLGSITLVQSKLSKDSSLSHSYKTALSKVDVGFDCHAPKNKHGFQTIQTKQSATDIQSHASTTDMHSVLPCDGSSSGGAQCMMPRLSTCPPGPGTSNNMPQRVSVKKSHRGIDRNADNAGSFSPDLSSLRSILQNEGIKVGDHFGATPRASTCPTGRGTSIYSAQRVPAKKTQKQTPVEATSPTKSAVSFSPDPAALCSILQNEGVRLGGAGGATPRVSTCLTGRGTSIYSAQRVPMKKTKTEATATVAAASHCANRTPVMKWTPQRVPNTKPQSMRKLFTGQKTSRFRNSPGVSEPHDPSTEVLTCHEGDDVVQRLFKEPEQMDDEQMKKDDISLEILNSHQTAEPHIHIKNDDKKAAQPFIQAAHRGSVIVFSSSQRLLGSGRPQEKPLAGAPLQLCRDSDTSHCTLPLLSDQSNGSQITPILDYTKQINTGTKSQSKVPPLVSALRQRHTPLEELFLDDECATYTSRLLSCPVQPRCGNPVATTLLFQDSTCFLPIGLPYV
ncbi:uncharacterized protein LOC127420601 isoform X2 [Myxocyprinus asiaticus]|uniref:uncharacterized protein LOC127420601 isoform X2 n=1 Tax=Myxocyprinus asiaticus TaxID=70543 RepID=UPI002222E976|nr:uncharacterized protein LOC127420601 isoform X2 [Myxocyprinus asiaticus]